MESLKFFSLVLIFSLSVIMLAGCNESKTKQLVNNSDLINRTQRDRLKWWDHFPRIVETSDVNVALEHNANIAMTGGQIDPGWGIYGQKVSEKPSITKAFHNAGLKNIGYFETFGESYCLLAELDNPSRSTEYNTVHTRHWTWHNYNGGTTVWIGLKNWFDDEPFARPWTRSHPVYGGAAMTYPDGTVATGYFDDDDTDPRKSRVYDASTSKDIDGNLSLTYLNNAKGPNDGKVYVSDTNNYASLVLFRKDSACPVFDEYTYASTLYAVNQGIDGMWSDNFSVWDSFGNVPIDRAFGEWSVACFRNYLSEYFTGRHLLDMGINDVNTFDIRVKLKSLNKSMPWKDAAWQDKVIWQAYMIFKRRLGTEALTRYTDTVHRAGKDCGTKDTVVLGNGIAVLSYGWPRGNLDMVSTEISAGWNLCSGPRGFMLAPVGRMAPFYKVAREHANSRFVNVWFYNTGYEDYLKDAPPAYTANPNICWVLYSEMLSTHTLPMFHPGKPKNTGSAAINSAFFEFVSRVEPVFGRRVPVEDIGIYYSSSSILNQMLPGGVKNFAAQPHQFAVWGWGTALDQLHYQYRAVPEWKLNRDTLDGLRVLVIGEAKVLDHCDVSGILMPWVRSGGRLIVTGVSGNRYGEGGNFMVNPSGYSLCPLTNVSNISSAPPVCLRTVGLGKVYYIKKNIGMDYFNADTARRSLLPDFAAAMSRVLGGSHPVVLTPGWGVDGNVGLKVFENICSGRLFVDVVNFNIDLKTDTITDTNQMTFTVDLPLWLQNKTLSISAVSPTRAPVVRVNTRIPGRVEITIDPVKYYAGVIVEAD